MSKKTFLILLVISLFALFLNVYEKSTVPPSFNADEAAFGYNVYSLSQTGKDEYGNFLPLRLKSFGDYKMPLYSYLSIPFVGLFGLSENSVRMLNTVLVFLFPFLVYCLVKELFDKKNTALVSSALVGLSWGLHSIGRQAHEAYLSVFLIASTLLFFLRLIKKITAKDTVLFLLSLTLLLFSYQTGRLFGILFLLLSFFYFLKIKGGKRIVLFTLLILLLFGITDLINQPKRVGNLLFFNTPGFALKINELRSEGGSRLFYNKISVGKREFLKSYVKYFSPPFLFLSGDDNPRFGFDDMGPISVLEYVFLFIGLYYLFRKKERYRYLLLILLLISPVPAALSWAGISLTRSLFVLIPILIIASYGVIQLYKEFPKKYALFLLFALILAETSLLFYTWDFYLNHYPKRALVIRAWQPGYRELTSYIKENYEKYDHFYITRKNGQPYIFLLAYLQFPPEKYQKQAQLSAPDEYGFGQVDRFDKFVFNTNISKEDKRYVVIGYPEDFTELKITPGKKIRSGTEEIFGIYEKIR